MYFMHYKCNFECVPHDSDYLASNMECILLYMSLQQSVVYTVDQIFNIKIHYRNITHSHYVTEVCQ